MLPEHTPFLNSLITQLEPQAGALAHLYLDHICYRVETLARYRELKQWLLTENEMLVESTIRGRLIAIFRMAQPFRFDDREIWFLELPEPKVNSFYTEGWEHAEFVTDLPLPEFEQWLIAALEINANDIDRSGLGKALNADLRLRLEDGLSVKFHELSLAEVIRIEGIPT